MKSKFKKIVILTLCSATLVACSIFEKDNTPTPTPLVKFTPEATLHNNWYASTNWGVGSGPDYLRLVPAVDGPLVFTAAKDGVITATNKTTGRKAWRIDTHHIITAGPSINANHVFVGTSDGAVLAYQQDNGQPVWKSELSSEVLAPPTANNRYVLAKTIDGQLTALSATDGHAIWHYQQSEPDLILRGGSTPLFSNNHVVVGFENGTLSKLTLHDGSLLWQQTIAVPEGSFPIQRMVDIDVNPVIYGNHIYVATYQGKIVALDLHNGHEVWSHKLSAFTGLTVDPQRVYVSDAQGSLWAFNRDTGTVEWKQGQLLARNPTGPAQLGNNIIIGDGLGYLHVLNKQDGHFIARTRVNRFGILASPVVQDDKIYVVTKDGHLASYSLG